MCEKKYKIALFGMLMLILGIIFGIIVDFPRELKITIGFDQSINETMDKMNAFVNNKTTCLEENKITTFMEADCTEYFNGCNIVTCCHGFCTTTLKYCGYDARLLNETFIWNFSDYNLSDRYKTIAVNHSYDEVGWGDWCKPNIPFGC